MKRTILETYIETGTRVLKDITLLRRRQSWWRETANKNLLHSDKTCHLLYGRQPISVKFSIVQAAEQKLCPDCAYPRRGNSTYNSNSNVWQELDTIVQVESRLRTHRTLLTAKSPVNRPSDFGEALDDLRTDYDLYPYDFQTTGDYGFLTVKDEVLDSLEKQRQAIAVEMATHISTMRNVFTRWAASEICRQRGPGDRKDVPHGLNYSVVEQAFAQWCNKRPDGRAAAIAAAARILNGRRTSGVKRRKSGQQFGCHTLPLWEKQYQNAGRHNAMRLIRWPKQMDARCEAEILAILRAFPHQESENWQGCVAIVPEVVDTWLGWAANPRRDIWITPAPSAGVSIEAGHGQETLDMVIALYDPNNDKSVYHTLDTTWRAVQALQ